MKVRSEGMTTNKLYDLIVDTITEHGPCTCQDIAGYHPEVDQQEIQTALRRINGTRVRRVSPGSPVAVFDLIGRGGGQ